MRAPARECDHLARGDCVITILAHGSAHLAESLIYLVPLVLVVGWLVMSSLRAARDGSDRTDQAQITERPSDLGPPPP